MDPYVEQNWLDFHSRLVTYICDQIQERLPEALYARMESRVLVEDEEGGRPQERLLDVHVAERPGRADRGGGIAVLAPPSSAADPDMFLLEPGSEPVTQRYIQIVDAQSGGRVVTAIELISPSNKQPGVGQRLYLAKREECLDCGVNLVEIDLTRGGNRLSILPLLGRLDSPPLYVACVRRAREFDRIGVYLFPLQRPLRPMRIPLRATDEDAILELQPLVAQAYDRGRYDTLDYRRELDPPLVGADAEFAAEVLKQAGKR